MTFPIFSIGNQAGFRTFNGTSQYLQLRGNSHVGRRVHRAGAVTVMARVKLDAAWAATGIVIDIPTGAATSATGIGLLVQADRKVRIGGRALSTDTYQQQAGATALTTGTWYTIFGVLDYANGDAQVYLNGSASADGTGAKTFGATSYTLHSDVGGNACIGAGEAPSAANFFKGAIMDVAVWRRELTSAERLSLHNGARPDTLNPALYWPLTRESDRDGYFAYSFNGGTYAWPKGGLKPATISGAPTLTDHTFNVRDKLRGCRVMEIAAGDATSVGIGNDVTSIQCNGSGSNAVQRGAEAVPDYEEVSGEPTLHFDSTNSETLEVDLGWLHTTDGFAIITLADVAVNGRIVSASGNAGTNEIDGFALSPTLGLILGNSNISNYHYSTFTDYTVGSTGLALFAARWSGNRVTNWLNSVRRNGTPNLATELSNGDWTPSNVPPSAVIEAMQIGSRENSGSRSFCSMHNYGMFIIYGAVTDEEIKYYEGVLAHRHGKTSLLPAGHPWKTAAPDYDAPISYPWGQEIVWRSNDPSTNFPSAPSIIRHNGKLFCSHQTPDTERTFVYVSRDGSKWRGVAMIDGLYEASLWSHPNGNMYAIGVDRNEGNLVIFKTTDEWATWTSATISNGTFLPAAGTGTTAPNYNGGNVSSLHSNDGFHFYAYSNRDPYDVFNGEKPAVIYIDDNDDPMTISNWAKTSELAIGGSTGYSNRTAPATATLGMIEPNILTDDLGAMYMVLSFAGSSTPNKAVVLPLTWSNPTLTMPTWDNAYIVDWIGGNVRMHLVDGGDGYAYGLVNENTAVAEAVGSGYDQDQRNRVVLGRQSLADLSTISFASVKTVLDDADVEADSGLSVAQAIQYVGMMYGAHVIEGGTSKYVGRIAWSGADDYHNGQFIGAGTTGLTA